MRLSEKFAQLSTEGKKAFIAYVPFGFPNISATKGICLTLQKSGVDIIELGIPFSDPLADGPIIQQATTQALVNGANMENFFTTLKGLRPLLRVPIVAMTYYNPILQFGPQNFLKRLKENNVCGVIVVDLPLEENSYFRSSASALGIDLILFVTPATSWQRAEKIASLSSGFIYYVSVTGITGPKNIKVSQVRRHVERLKKITSTKVCIGFGIHTRQQVKAMQSFADGAIVGSAIVSFIDAHHRNKDFLKKLETYVRGLCSK